MCLQQVFGAWGLSFSRRHWHTGCIDARARLRGQRTVCLAGGGTGSGGPFGYPLLDRCLPNRCRVSAKCCRGCVIFGYIVRRKRFRITIFGNTVLTDAFSHHDLWQYWSYRCVSPSCFLDILFSQMRFPIMTFGYIVLTDAFSHHDLW